MLAAGVTFFSPFCFTDISSRWKEPLRHALIRLRVQKPGIFGNRPIPFRDRDIRRDDSFMAILAQEVTSC